MILHLYRLLTWLISPFVHLYLVFRSHKGKEDTSRMREREGHASIPRPEGSLVWIHAASVGESMSVLPLINQMLEEYPDLFVLVTTGTVTSAAILERRLPERAFHHYVPLDYPLAVRRFLKHWKPDLAILLESELWPNLIIETFARRCPIVLLNARMSRDSFSYWNRMHMKMLVERMLQCFSIIFPQSEEDGARFRMLGGTNILFVGNLKFDSPPLPVDPKDTSQLLGMLGDRPVWMAASTHPNEEIMVAETHRQLKEKYPDILSIIVPRHPERGEEIATELRKLELKVSLRSLDQTIGDNIDIYIADTLGELGLFYRVTNIVLMGGSLVDHGGQNPLEAARLNCAIICGPYMSNFSAICRELAEHDAYIRIDDVPSLVETVDLLISDHDQQEEFALAAKKVVDNKRGCIDAVLGALDMTLSTLSRKKSTAKNDDDEDTETNSGGQSSKETDTKED